MSILDNYLQTLYEQEYYPRVDPMIERAFSKYVGECRRRYIRPVTDEEKRKLRSCENKAKRRAYQLGRRYLENKRQSTCRKAQDPKRCNQQTTASIQRLKTRIVALNKLIYTDDKILGRV